MKPGGRERVREELSERRRQARDALEAAQQRPALHARFGLEPVDQSTSER